MQSMASAPLSQERFVVSIAKNERRVRSFIATLVSHEPDAIDEVLQSTYLVAWQKLDSFTYADSTPDEELVRWVCTIARFEVKDYLRRRKPAKMTALSNELLDRIADVQMKQPDLLEARYEALSRCLTQLRDSQRELLRLRYGRGLSVKELAARQGKPEGAVYTMLSRIRKLLQHCTQQDLLQKGYGS